MPFLLPNQQCQSTEGNTNGSISEKNNETEQKAKNCSEQTITYTISSELYRFFISFFIFSVFGSVQ